MINLQIDPEICCKLPTPFFHPEYESQCLDECSQVKKRPRCCIRRCKAAKMGIYVNGTFSKEALKDYFIWSEGEKLKESWRGVVDKSVDFCAEKCE